LRGLERRERRVRQGREVRKEKSVILWKALELRVKIFSPGVESGVVMVLMLFDEAERDVRDGKKLVNFTI
jgi:deoxyhypusine synthase